MFGKEFEKDGVQLTLHPRQPLKANLVLDQLQAWGVDATRNAGGCYAILEGYALSLTAPEGSGLRHYWETRGQYQGKERYEWMMSVLDTNDMLLVIEAHNVTREVLPELEGDGKEKKEASSPTSSA